MKNYNSVSIYSSPCRRKVSQSRKTTLSFTAKQLSTQSELYALSCYNPVGMKNDVHSDQSGIYGIMPDVICGATLFGCEAPEMFLGQ